MTESIRESNPQVSKVISIHTLIGAVGFTLSMATLLLGIYSAALASCFSDPASFATLRGVALLSMAATYFTMYRFIRRRDAAVRTNGVKLAFFVLQTILPALVLVQALAHFEAPSLAIAAAWALWGISNGYFACSWIDGLSNVNEERVSPITFAAFCGAGALVALASALPSPLPTVAYLAMSTAAFVILLGARKDIPGREADDSQAEKWLHEKVKFKKNGSYILFVDGLIIANVAAFILAKIIRWELSPALMGAVLIAATLLFFAVRKWRPSLLSLGTCQLFLMPIVVCGLVLMIFLTELPQIIVAIILFVFLYLLEVANVSGLSERGALMSVSPCYCFAKGRVFMILGQGVGWMLGAFLASTPMRCLPILFTILLFLLCLYATFATLAPDRYLQAGKESDEPSENEPAPVVAEENKEVSLKEKCTLVTLAYDLTPREGEILYFLAKGRNAKHIAEKLFVAERTAKTHIYHIYQKMEVHSQQELISLIDDFNAKAK